MLCRSDDGPAIDTTRSLTAPATAGACVVSYPRESAPMPRKPLQTNDNATAIAPEAAIPAVTRGLEIPG